MLIEADFNPRSDVIGILDLVEIDAPSGLARFAIGRDGVFRDTLGRAWYGSQVLGCEGYDWTRGQSAEEGVLSISYFQDPDAPDLVDQLRATGDLDIAGRAVRFYIQRLTSVADFYAPRLPPVLAATRVARAVGIHAQGDTIRRITLSFEGALAGRRRKRGYFYIAADHNRLLGNPDPENPSLEFVPIDGRPEEPLFG